MPRGTLHGAGLDGSEGSYVVLVPLISCWMLRRRAASVLGSVRFGSWRCFVEGTLLGSRGASVVREGSSKMSVNVGTTGTGVGLNKTLHLPQARFAHAHAALVAAAIFF